MDSTPPPPTELAPLLLVDSNELLRVGLHAWLGQEFPQYQIDTATSREQAARLAATRPPVLALVDIDARDGEGYAALRSLHAQLPSVPLVALSVYQVEYFSGAAMQAGAVACACITMRDSSLRDLLRALLRPSQGQVS